MPKKYTIEEYNQILIDINSPLRVAPDEEYINIRTPIKHISTITNRTFKVRPKYVIRSKNKLRESRIGKGNNRKRTTEEYKQELVDKGLTCTLAPGEEYINMKKKIWHICSCGIPFLKTPSQVLFQYNDKCPECVKKIRTKNQASLALSLSYSHQEFLKVLDKINPNIRVVQGQTYKNSYTKLWFHCCKCGVATLSSPSNVIRAGIVLCKECRKKSLGEQIIAQYLEDNGMFCDPEHRFDDCKNILPLPFDFWVDNSFAIEYDGNFHYNDVYGYLKEQQKRDKIKDAYCIFYQIPLIRIKESEYNKFQQMQKDITKRLKQGISKLQWGDDIIIKV